jgi:tetratricopeptide (TPR) repeat protein
VPKQERQLDPGDLKVLIIDDHPQMRKAIARVLVSLDFSDITEAGTGSDAIKILKDEPIDLVICDLYLLDVSGFDVIEFIRNRAVDSDIPVIVVTGEASKEDIVKAADLGANDYLLKPFRTEDLSQKVVKLATEYQSPPPATRMRRRAERLYLEKKYEDALNVIQDCTKLDGDSVNIRHLLALVLVKKGDLNAAIEILNRNIELNDNFYKTYATLAEVHLQQGKKNEAIEFMLRELELNPKQPRRQTQVANLLLGVGRVEDAIDHFRQALKENVRYKHALFGMGQAYAALDNVDKAIYYFRRLRRYYPTNTTALEAIVKVCLNAKDPRKAEYALKDERTANKNKLDTYIVLGKLYLATDEKDKAIAILDEMLKLKPDSIQGLKLKAAVYMRYNDFNPAITIYEKLLKQEDDPETRIQLADIYFRSKRFLDAILTLHGTVKQKIDKNGPMSRLATAYAHTNQSLKAHILFMKIANTNGIPPKFEKAALEAQKSWKLRRIQRHKPVAS